MAYRYHVSDDNKKVICISSFAKKPVRGIAKCDTNYDEFDVETGKQLAGLPNPTGKKKEVKMTPKIKGVNNTQHYVLHIYYSTIFK